MIIIPEISSDPVCVREIRDLGSAWLIIDTPLVLFVMSWCECGKHDQYVRFGLN